MSKVRKIVKSNRIDYLIPDKILSRLTKISKSFERHTQRSKKDDFGLSIYTRYKDFLRKYKKVTIFEMKNSRFASNLLHFLFKDKLGRKLEKAKMLDDEESKTENLDEFPERRS